MRLDTLTYGAMRWMVAAAAAGAFVVTLSVQTVRGDSVAAPAAASVETAITSDSTPAVPAGAGKLVAVSVPGLRAPVPHKPRHHAAPAPTPATELVSAPAVTPTPVPVPTAAPPAAVAPPPAPAKTPPKPAAPAHGPGFDSSG
jgi:outer membrane biosynthesis protein TonB